MSKFLLECLKIWWLFLCLSSIVPLFAKKPPFESNRKHKIGKHCFDQSALDITSENGYLNYNNQRFNLKGVSWFGFETSQYVVHGLWEHDYHWYVDFLSNYSFNALRLPFSVDMIVNNPIPNSISFYEMNDDLVNLTAIEVYDKIIIAMGNAGILVMLDMHSLEAGAYLENGLWYDSTYNINDVENVWNLMFKKYGNNDTFWNVFAIDVFNEPFDGTWDKSGNNNKYSNTYKDNDNSTDWPSWCEKMGNMAHSVGNENWLIFCEGVADSPSCDENCFWGEDLQGVSYRSVELNVENKVVYSPHSYGPSVAYQDYFNTNDFPQNMPAIWDNHYGFIRNYNQSAIVVGEWGGYMTGSDEEWMNEFGKYLIERDMKDNFFWCLNSDSGDTGGLLDNWDTPDESRLNLTNVIQPNPTKITNLNGHICIEM